MNRESDHIKMVETALESLDSIQKAEPAPYFYTRLRARMEREEKNIWERIASILSKPAVAFASLFLILAFNAFFLFQNSGSTPATGNGTNITSGNSLAEDYFTLASNSFDYENLEP